MHSLVKIRGTCRRGRAPIRMAVAMASASLRASTCPSSTIAVAGVNDQNCLQPRGEILSLEARRVDICRKGHARPRSSTPAGVSLLRMQSAWPRRPMCDADVGPLDFSPTSGLRSGGSLEVAVKRFANASSSRRSGGDAVSAPTPVMLGKRAPVSKQAALEAHPVPLLSSRAG